MHIAYCGWIVRLAPWRCALASFLVLLFAGSARAAQPPVGLGTAGAFAVLGGSTVTNTGPSVVGGDLGAAPGAAITGFPPGVLNGTLHAADAVAAQAQLDVKTAYVDAAGRVPAALLPADLGGLFLTAGVHRRESALGLTGDVTFDAEGDPAAVFVVQAGTLTAAANSRVRLTGRAQACRVFWQIASSATLGTDAVFAGNLLALQSITLNTRATLSGRVLARNGAVTLDTNTIRTPGCTTVGPGPNPGPGVPPGPGTPAPAAPSIIPTVPGPAAPGPAAGVGAAPARAGTAILATEPRSVGRTAARYGDARCVERTFRAVVTGVNIRLVRFLVDGRTVTTQDEAPFAATIRMRRGNHKLRARVSFDDGTRPRSIRFRFRPCRQVTRRAPTFTG